MSAAPPPRNAAEAAVATAHRAGVEVCFANPGTTEMEWVAALDAVTGVRAVLGLFEGVCTGAADGYGRMAGKPALTLLHLGPGLANGIANLHNARRAGSPVVNVIGDHASWHRAADAPLTSDIEALAGPVSAWVRTSASAGDLAGELAAAVAAAWGPPAQVASLVVPQDCAWGEAEPGGGDRAGARGAEPHAEPPEPVPPEQDRIEAAAGALRHGDRALLYLGGRALRPLGLEAAARIAAATGCRVLHETFPARLERGAGLPAFDALPYFPEQAAEALAPVTHAVVVGAPEPVAFFGYRNGRSRLLPDGCSVMELAEPATLAEEALEALAEALGATAGSHGRDAAPAPTDRAIPSGALDVSTLGGVLAALQPEGAIVVNEAATSGLGWVAASAGAPPHTMLSLTGGAIGQGLPNAVGAALACPDRRVIAFQADGSGMYTVQALWTMAREALDVVVVVCANRSYRILQYELGRSGVTDPGQAARDLMDLTRPDIDWVALARGLGIPGGRVVTAEGFASELRTALAGDGPYLIEAIL